MSRKEAPEDLEDLEELDLEEPFKPSMTLTLGPSVAPATPPTPSTGLTLGKPIVEEARDILNLDDSDLDVRQKLFLIAYATYGTVSKACKAIGVSPLTHNKWLKESEEYAATFSVAFDIITDKLEEVSLQAATEPLNVKERIFHLENRRPERYARVKKVQLGGDLSVKHSLAELTKAAFNGGMMEED